MMNARASWVAWIALVVAWIGLAIYVIDMKNERLCTPTQPVAVRLAQPKGAREVGVVYLDFQNARATRDRLDEWLRQYGHC